MRLEVDPVVGDPVLREVVGPDPLGAIDGADLAGAVRRGVGLGLFLGQDLQSRREDLHGAGLVLQLRAFVLAGDDDPGGQVGDAHSRVGGVHALAALAGGPVDVDAQIRLIDLDLFDLFGFGVDQHPGRRSVHAPLGFSDGDPLDAVHAALPFQSRPDPVGRVALAADGDGGFLVPAEVGERLVQNGHRPSAPFGVADVHPSQVGGEQRRFLTTFTGFDL